MVDKCSAFSIDAILADDCSRSQGEVVSDHAAVVSDPSNSSSVDDAWLRQLFSDVARRLLVARSVADTIRSSSVNFGKETNIEVEQYTNNISSLVESKSSHWQRFPSSVSSWLDQRPRSIHSLRTPSFDSRTSAYPDQRRREHAIKELPYYLTSERLHATSVDHSGQELRRAELNVVDGCHRRRSLAPNDVDATSRYFDEVSAIKADSGSQTAWLTRFHGGLRGDSRDANIPNRLNSSDRSTTDSFDDVENEFSAMKTDSTQLLSTARPFTGK